MTHPADPVTPPPTSPVRQPGPSFRFVALMAYLVASVALGIDLMLASLLEIGEALSPSDPERATLVMGSFFMALGVGTLFVGPLLDAFGRRPVILIGLGLYALGGLLSWLAPTLTLMLLGRALMGLGAAAPRVGVQAIIRDRFEGRRMAAAISVVMMVFTLVPGIAPMLGAWIADLFGWRAVFFVFILFGLAGAAWFALQQPETLKVNQPLAFGNWLSQIRASLALQQFRDSLLLQLFTYASLYALLTAGPAIYTQAYGLGEVYPYIFGFVSICGAGAAFANARLVERLGMVRLMTTALAVYTGIVGLCLVANIAGGGFWSFFVPMFAAFFVLGFVVGNSQALAMQELGHVAGTASSTLVAAATLGAGALAIPIPLFFDGSPLAMISAQLAFAVIALIFARRFPPDEAPA